MVQLDLEERYKKFIGYFEFGFPAGWNDLAEKAEEFDLPIPKRILGNGELKLVWGEETNA